MAQILLEKKPTSFVSDRTTPMFEDPTEKGLKKICSTSWIEEMLSRTPVDEDFENLCAEADHSIDDLHYELADIF